MRRWSCRADSVLPATSPPWRRRTRAAAGGIAAVGCEHQVATTRLTGPGERPLPREVGEASRSLHGGIPSVRRGTCIAPTHPSPARVPGSLSTPPAFPPGGERGATRLPALAEPMRPRRDAVHSLLVRPPAAASSFSAGLAPTGVA